MGGRSLQILVFQPISNHMKNFQVSTYYINIAQNLVRKSSRKYIEFSIHFKMRDHSNFRGGGGWRKTNGSKFSFLVT